MTFGQSSEPVRLEIRSQTNDSSPSTNTQGCNCQNPIKYFNNVFVQFLSSSPNDSATSNEGGVATFWCEQCAVTTFVRLLKTRSATSIVKDWQLWAIRAWIAHCARPLKAVAPFITGAIDLGLKLMRMLEIIMMLLEINFISWIDWFKKAIKNFWSTLLVAAHTDGVIGACQSSLAVRFAKGLYVRYDL